MKQDTKTNTNTHNETPKKYELTDEYSGFHIVKLFRIRALRDFLGVKAGQLGGFIQSEDNLSHEGNAWVGGEAHVFGKAQVRDNAFVTSHARVFDRAQISGNAIVRGYAAVSCEARVLDDAVIGDQAEVCDAAVIQDSVLIEGATLIGGAAQVYGKSYLLGNAFVASDADIDEDRAVLVIDNLGDSGDIITAYQQRDGSIGVTCRDHNGDCTRFGNLNSFKACVNRYTATEFKEEYLAAINLIKIRFNQHTN